MAPNKDIFSLFWGAPGLPGGAPDHFGMPGGRASPHFAPLLPPPENGFFENPGHDSKDRDFCFFAKLLILIVFHYMESQLQLELLKGVNQGVPPPENP